ncbi:MAG: four helix bundle protein [bacterium]
MPHKTFEELPVWRLGRDLVRRVYALTHRSVVVRDHGFRDQIQRAAVSVTNNIAEGHERGTTVELAVFLFYAKGSAGEVRSMLWNAEDIGYLNLLEAGELRQLAGHIGAQLHQWIASMQTPDFKPGPKYHQEPPTGLRRWELYLEQQGLFRLPDGRYVERTPGDGEKGSDDGGT